MTINATLIGQMITFALFVWFTMRFVWPHINKALDDRQTKITDGLAAAERGHRELALAQDKVIQELREAKEQATVIVDSANRRANQLVEEAKQQALIEKQRMLDRAQEEIALELTHAKASLRKEVAGIAMAGAEKILAKAVDVSINERLLDELANEL